MHRWKNHILFWVVVYVIWMYMKNYSLCFDIPTVLINLVQLVAYMAIYYAIREILTPKYFDHGRWWIFGIAVIGWTLLVLFLWNRLLKVLSGMYEIPHNTIPESSGAYILEGVQMFVPGLILLAWESYQDAQSEEQRLHILDKERITTEISYLKSKVNPQFIFNTLKNLKIFVDEKSNRAPDMILKLSEILDYVLYRSQLSSVILKEELSVINAFLELEKLRLGDRFVVSIRTEGSMSIAIAPLTILSLIQCVLKVGISNHSNQLSVDILIATEYPKINCDIRVIDKCDFEINSIALNEIQRQLSLTYSDRHSLSQNEVHGATVTSLSLISVL